MSLVDVEAVQARLEPYRWEWADANEALVGETWRARVAEQPRLFDGEVLMLSWLAVADGVAAARFFATRYSRLLAWLGAGCPDGGVANGFAMGALQARDGAFLLGRMAPHTANAGRLYFPCGTPDRSDVTGDGIVDLAGSLEREITEETGLPAADLAVEPGWTIARHGGLVAFMRRVRLPFGRGEALARIGRHLASEREPELAEVVAVDTNSALGGTDMPGVVPLYLARAFAGEGRR